MSKIRLSGSNSGYVEIAAAADAGNLTFTMPTTGTALFGNGNNVISGITTYNAALDINSSIDVSGTSVFNNDVTFDGATAGYDVVWDRSFNALEFADNAKLAIGSGTDLLIYHDGNNSLIRSGGNGQLQIESSNNTSIVMGNAGLVETIFKGSVNGAVELYFNNSKKIETTNTGAVVTGICTATSFSGDGSALTGISASADVVSDTSPQLGGNLDVNGKDIVSTSNGDIDLAPNGTGAVVFKGVSGNGGNGAGRFKLNCEVNSHGITIQGPPHSAGANYTLTLPNTDGNANQVLKTNGSGVLDWVDQASSGLGSRQTNSTTTGSLSQNSIANTAITTAGKSFSLLSITVSAPAYVVLYIDVASRNADSSRGEGTDPAPGSGVLAEVSTTTNGSTTFLMTPAVLGWNNDSTPTAQVHAKIKNKRTTSGSNSITVTLKTLALEA